MYLQIHILLTYMGILVYSLNSITYLLKSIHYLKNIVIKHDTTIEWPISIFTSQAFTAANTEPHLATRVNAHALLFSI